MSDTITYNLAVANGKLDAEYEYWKLQLQGDLVLSAFPADLPRGDAPEKASHECVFPVAPDLVTRLLQMSRGSTYSLYVLILAAVNVLLAKYSRSQEVVVGMPVFRQESKDGRHLNHLLLLRTSLEECGTFRDLVLSTKDTVTEANRYQNFPIRQALQLAGLRTEDEQVLVRTLVLHDQIHDSNIVQPGETHAQFIVQGKDEELQLMVRFDASLYTADAVERWMVHLERLLRIALFQPDRRLADLQLIDEEETNLTLNQFNSTAVAYDQEETVHGLFEKMARAYPDAPAAIFDTQTLCYGELNEKAGQLARVLRTKGVGPDQPVGIMTDRSPEMIIGILAILKAGGAYLPIDPGYPKERIAYLLQDSQARLLLVKGALVDLPFAGETLDLEDECWYQGESILGVTSGPRHLAYVIYTSGSTGQPKGVMIEHHAVINRLQWMQKRYPLTEQDVILQKTPFSFDVSVWELFWWGMTGASAAFLGPGEEKNPQAIVEAVERWGVTVMHFVPSMLHLFLEAVESTESEKQLSSLRRVFISGEALQVPQAHRCKRLLSQTELVNLYGPTEATVDVSFHDCTGDADLMSVPIGKPIDNIELYVIDEQQHLQPIGVPGELCIAGAGLARGYWNRPELTREKFVDNPFRPGTKMYKTGDLARWLPNGEIEYLGRLDHQVKVRGYRIELGEIEAALVKVTGIQEAVVAAREVEPGIKDLCAYYTKQGDLTAGDIRQALTERMPGYMVPGYFVELAEMPLTPNGKLDRKRLPDPRGHLQRETKYEAPRNETEAKLVTIWQKALVLERIGIDDRYFDIGGDSIKSIRVITSINREWKIELQLIEFYQHPTIRELAAFLQAKERRVEDGRRAAVIQEMESWKSQLVEQANDPSWLTHGVEDYYPLSDIQQGMIYHSLSRPDLYAYHDQFVYQFEDKTFNEDAFLTALTALVDKHPILRTEFNLQDFTAPVQIVRERGTLDYELISLVGMNKEQQEAAIFRAMEEDRKRPFFQNGVAASPWRMRLFCLDQCNYSIGWFYHHALLDGWSNALVITELSALYFAGKQGEIQVEPLAYSYKELLIEQAMLKQGEDIATYWRRELDDCKRLEVLTAQNSAILDQAFIKTTLTFGSDTGVMLRQFAAEHKTTIKAVCFSAYTAMMNSMAREGDFLVGLVVNNRPLCADGEQILGCFLNTVPVRVRVEKEITWLDLLDDMNRKLTEIQQYGRVSLQHIQQVIGKTTFESSSLFDNFFNYVDFHVLRRIDAKQLAHGVIDINNFERTNSDLDFTCVFAEEQLSIVLTTAERAYPKAVAERLLAIYERALHAIIETPERPMKKSDLLLPDQLDYLCQRAARMARVVPPGTIHERFESQAAYRPTEPALAARDQELTYGELNRRANQLARRLQESGVGPGNIVGLMCGRTVELIIGLLAILKTGGAYLPIDPTYPQERIRHMIEDSGTQLLLSTETLLGVGTYTGKWINLENSSLYEGESPNLGATIGEKDLAYCIYTSGSTGRPKGVLLEHRNVVNLLLGMVERIDFRPGNTFVSVTTVSFDIFVLETLLPLMNGMRVVLATEKEQADPAALGRLLAASQADIFQTTPSRIQLLLGDEIGRAGLAGLSEILIGGEPFHMDLIKSLRTCTKARLHNMYGPTETTVWSMTVDLTHAEEVTLGEPIANTEILLLDSNGEIQMFDAIGELCIAGDGLARGYHNREDLTQEKFIQHPLDPERRLYKTGDLALWRTNGEILYLGRLDQQVKIRGHRVELGEIEHALASVEGLQKPIAAAVPSESGEKLLVAYYLAPEELPVFELRGHLALLLPDYMLPNAFVRLDSYPLLPNGKIDRKALPAPLLTREALGVPYQEAESKTEKELVRLWQSVLGVETIGVHDNFFELGGSSISLVQFHVKLEQLYPGRVTIAELFSHSTVRNLAVRLEQSDTQSVINIKTITLPKRFQARGARSEGAALQFALPAPLTEGLRELALQEKVDLEDILLTAGLYLFGEIVHDQPITLYAMEERDVLRPVSVERSQVRDFSEFFQQVRMARHDSSIDIAMDAVRLLAFRNQAGQVAPLFYRQDSVRSGERLGEWFGFALGHADSSGTIKFVCDYDGGLLQRNALEEWIRGFVRLLQAILIKMKPEV